ncbi:MAG: hypothetical protein LBL26_05490 [Peptococcaceae bacterium]|nr:hypothetical protein [Peptococcaceae bacterium]
MAYKIHCHVEKNQFYETTLEEAGEMINFMFENRGDYSPIKVFQAQEDGLFNCVLMMLDGEVQWGEYSLLKSAQIREQELNGWPEVAADPEYQRVTLDQVEDYYERHRDEILDSVWPEFPEMQEVVVILAHENNTGLFKSIKPSATKIIADGRDISSENIPWFMRLTLQNTETGKSGFAMYPCDKYDMLDSLDTCGIPYGSGKYAHLAVSANGVEADSLQIALTGIIEHSRRPPSIQELNHLGTQIQDMTAEERRRLEREIAGLPEATIVEAIRAAYGALSKNMVYDGVSMSERAVLFADDEPYIRVQMVPDNGLAHENEEDGIWINCPATAADFDAAAEKLGISARHDLRVNTAYGILADLENDVFSSPDITYGKLNDLALTMKNNSIHRELAKYKAVLSLEFCHDIREAAELAGRLDEYEFYPGASLSAVGGRFQDQNLYEQAEDDLAEDLGFEETRFGTVRKTDGIEQTHSGLTPR